MYCVAISDVTGPPVCSRARFVTVGGALILYKFRLERGSPLKEVAPPVERLLTVLAGPATAEWVSFRAIAEQAMVKGSEAT